MNQFLVQFNINMYDAVKAYKSYQEICWTIRSKMIDIYSENVSNLLVLELLRKDGLKGNLQCIIIGG